MFWFDSEAPISLEVLATFAQVLPALLAIGLLVPMLSRMPMASPERFYFASQTIVVLLTEGTVLYLLLQGQPAAPGFRILIWSACFYSFIGIAIVAIAWARSSPAERKAEREAYEHQKELRQQKGKKAAKRERKKRSDD
jgi:hypothetical protein